MDVLLVNAGVKLRNKHSRLSPPLGLAYIGSVLQRNEFSVAALDMNCLKTDPEQMDGIVQQWSPLILGISVQTETYPNGLRLAHVAKQVDPRIVVVMGGPHATVMYDAILKEPDVDIVVRGEGEYTMLELAQCLVRNMGEMSEIQGIAFRHDDQVCVTPERSFIADPDELPFPARGLFPIPLYEQPGQLLMSRGGCPFDCCFCAVNNIWHGKRRFRSAENVVRELQSISQHLDTDDISFADDTFTLSKAHVAALCERSGQIRESLGWHWGCTTRVDLVDEPLLKLMAESGCYAVTFGIETGSAEVMKAIAKKITLDQVRHSVQTALDLNLAVLCSFMFPHPQDTAETIRDQKQFMKELVGMGAQVSLAFTTPFPGTDYYARKDQLGIRLLTDRWDEFDAKHLIIETANLKKPDLEILFEEIIQDVGLRHD